MRRCGCKYFPPWRLYCKVRVLGDCYSSVIILCFEMFHIYCSSFYGLFWDLGNGRAWTWTCVFWGTEKRKQTTLHTFLSSSCLFIFPLKRTCKDKVRAFFPFDSAWSSLTNEIETWRLSLLIYFICVIIIIIVVIIIANNNSNNNNDNNSDNKSGLVSTASKLLVPFECVSF